MKGYATGAKNGRARFTNTGARMLRKYYAKHRQRHWNEHLNHPEKTGTSVAHLADRFRCSTSTMWCLLNEKTYPNLKERS